MRSFKIGEREIVLCHTRDGVFAVDNMCTHALARLSEGFLKGTRLTCPLHGASFDVRDGRALGGPTAAPIVVHPTRVVNGVVEVALLPPEPT
jgi:nitrite reductase/ring-hydroxylating ferredoxin subunit